MYECSKPSPSDMRGPVLVISFQSFLGFLEDSAILNLTKEGYGHLDDSQTLFTITPFHCVSFGLTVIPSAGSQPPRYSHQLGHPKFERAGK